MAEPMIRQACDMVHRDQFTASLMSLGLKPTPAHPSDKSRPTTSTGTLPKCSQQPTHKTKYVQVSLCSMMLLSKNKLSKIQLLKCSDLETSLLYDTAFNV